MLVRLLLFMFIVVSCQEVNKETTKSFTVTDWKFNGDYIIMDTPDNEIGVMVFRKDSIIMVESDTTVLTVHYDSNDKIEFIFFYYTPKTNL